MSDNLKLEVFQTSLIELVNQSELPAGVLVLVFEKFLNQLSQANQRALQKETQELQEQQSEVIKDDSKSITSVTTTD